MAEKKRVHDAIQDIERLISDKNPPIDLKAFRDEWLKNIGGIAGLAKMLQQEWEEARPGGQTRARLTQLLVKVIDLTTPKTRIGDMEHLEEADLERLAAGLIQKVSNAEEETSVPTGILG